MHRPPTGMKPNICECVGTITSQQRKSHVVA